MCIASTGLEKALLADQQGYAKEPLVNPATTIIEPSKAPILNLKILSQKAVLADLSLAT
jgi:hypothetical protein